MALRQHAVVIAGGGPTGLMLAAELALAGVDVAIAQRRANQDITGQRAGGLLSRTIEVFDQRGIADRFLAEGQTGQVGIGLAGVVLDVSDFPTRHPYGLGLWQQHVERILGGWVRELGVPIYWQREVSGCTQDQSGVDIRLADGESVRAEYLVGCDGGRSVVRKVAGIDFPGWDASTSALLAQVEMSDEPPWGIHPDAFGTHAFGRLENNLVRVMVTESQVGQSGEPTLRDLGEALVAVRGTDYGIHSPVSISRFTDMTRQAETYRKGRVLLAGDAAHIHSPDGGQGLNLGVQDAVNLGWKLARVVQRIAPEDVLDTYHAERHPVAARSLRYTMALVALRRPDERIKALSELVAELVHTDEGRKRLAGRFSGLDIQYDFGTFGTAPMHPLLGRRVPDLDIVAPSGTLRVFSLLHEARPVLLNFSGPGRLDISPWADRVRLVDAHCAGPWELPVVGSVAAPTAVLVRPDGYVAWVGEGSDAGLVEALSRWFGPPAVGSHPFFLHSQTRRRTAVAARNPGMGIMGWPPAPCTALATMSASTSAR
jgi:2-polyprenyl-6-methoxyphenol hydroxylase-like FAD-dependent oxidoreductase